MILGAVAFVALSARYQEPINNDRQDLELVFNEDLRKNLSPEIAWRTAMLGSFRGLLVNMLWVRIESLKAEGKYFEAKGLAEEICKLQPRFPPVWVFHSWNMAWNISVATHTPEQRWKWVYNGIRLVRDRGIVYNPRSNWLYRQIAWTYFNKMGEWTDDMHRSYKRYWAMRMYRLFGPRMSEATNERVIEQFRAIAEAPKTIEEFIAAAPGAVRASTDADAPKTIEEIIAKARGNRGLVEAVRGIGLPLHDGVSLNESQASALRPLAAVDAFLDAFWQAEAGGEATLAKLAVGASAADSPAVAVMKVIKKELSPERHKKLMAFIQGFILRNRYQLDPELMFELMVKYGPFDWACVEAHGLYWVVLGTRKSPKWEINDELDRLNTERILLYALRNLSRRGWLVFEPNPVTVNSSYFHQLPDLRFIDITHEMYQAIGKRYNATPHWRGESGGQYLGSGHQFFLHEAVRQLYFNGDEERAAFYYKWLRENFREPNGVTIKQMYTKSLDRFVLGEARGQIDIFRGTSDTINGLLHCGFVNLAQGEGVRYVKCLNQARKLWGQYMAERKNDENPRRQLPDYRRMLRDQLSVFFRLSSKFGPARSTPHVGLISKARLWERLPTKQRQSVWDTVSPALKIQCRRHNPPLDFAKAFPEPPDMAKYRKANPSRVDRTQPERTDRTVPVTQPRKK